MSVLLKGKNAPFLAVALGQSVTQQVRNMRLCLKGHKFKSCSWQNNSINIGPLRKALNLSCPRDTEYVELQAFLTRPRVPANKWTAGCMLISCNNKRRRSRSQKLKTGHDDVKFYWKAAVRKPPKESVTAQICAFCGWGESLEKSSGGEVSLLLG